MSMKLVDNVTLQMFSGIPASAKNQRDSAFALCHMARLAKLKALLYLGCLEVHVGTDPFIEVAIATRIPE